METRATQEKMKYFTTYLFIIILLFLTGLSAYNYFHKPFLNEAEVSSMVPELENSNPLPTAVPKKELKTIDKLAQLIVVPVEVEEIATDASNSARMMRFIKDFQPGIVTYFGEEISTESATLTTEKIYASFSETDYLPLISVDHEGGSVQRLSGEGFTKLDPWQTIVNEYSNAQQKAVFNQSAKELYDVGVNMVFGPVVDLASSSAVLKSRSASGLEETFEASSNYIYGFAQYNIMPVVKHFPGIGSIRQDPHFAVSAISLSKDDTAIFSKLLDRFSNIGVMTTHVRIADKFDGQVCSLSVDCVGKFSLLYPQILLFTDDLSMAAAKSRKGTNQIDRELGEVAVDALIAGNDILLFGRGTSAEELEKVLYVLENEYNDSLSFRNRVDASLAKILKLKN